MNKGRQLQDELEGLDELINGLYDEITTRATPAITTHAMFHIQDVYCDRYIAFTQVALEAHRIQHWIPAFIARRGQGVCITSYHLVLYGLACSVITSRAPRPSMIVDIRLWENNYRRLREAIRAHIRKTTPRTPRIPRYKRT